MHEIRNEQTKNGIKVTLAIKTIREIEETLIIEKLDAAKVNKEIEKFADSIDKLSKD